MFCLVQCTGLVRLILLVTIRFKYYYKNKNCKLHMFYERFVKIFYDIILYYSFNIILLLPKIPD